MSNTLEFVAPYGTFDSHPMTGSTSGYPPLLNPAEGEIFVPKKKKTEQVAYYVDSVDKLVMHIIKALPEGHVMPDFTMRTPSYRVTEAAYTLSFYAFVLGEACPGHQLLKIITLKDFDEFREAVDVL